MASSSNTSIKLVPEQEFTKFPYFDVWSGDRFCGSERRICQSLAVYDDYVKEGRMCDCTEEKGVLNCVQNKE